ncbi:YitT family protein [Clostridium sporogenes]|uniref:YitT family protein n=1 Tax=Clostridium sporogenes TaxID=1509 RepID=UPI00214A0194|nr:YitT family protein [Clostridium sporogenes]MCR1972636.1 YitT family protein [Clostridium sporogenes]
MEIIYKIKIGGVFVKNNRFKEYLFITIGVFLVATSVVFFFQPNNIAAGGTTGIAIIINSFFPSLSVGLLMLIMEVFLYTIAFIVIGNKFGAKTIYSGCTLAAIIWILEKLDLMGGKAVTNDLLLASLFGVFISAIGMGIVFNQNASTGGTDILAKIINKFFHIEIGKALLIVDFLVTLFAAASFGVEKGMYALLCVVINGFTIDAVIEGLNMSKQIMIISKKNKAISEFIIQKLERGCTIFHGKGVYSDESTYILYTVLSRKEFIKLKQHIKEVDSKAFITVSDAHEVLGEGFKDIIEEA